MSVPRLRFPGFVGEWEEEGFEDVFESLSTRNHQILASEIKTNGRFAVVDQGKDQIAGYSDDEHKVVHSLPMIIFGDHTTCLKFVDFPFVIGADGTKPIKAKHGETAFQYYNLFLKKIEPEGYKRHFSILRKLTLSTPTLPEQKKIAAFLGAVDAKIVALRARVSGLQTYKRGLMQALFSQRLRFTKPDGTAFPDWEEKRLGDFCDALSGYPVPGDEILEMESGVRLLRGANITEGLVRRSPELDRYHGGNVAKLSRFFVEAGDVVIGMDGSKVGKNVAVISAEEAGSFLIQRVTRLRKNSSNFIVYVYYHIISPRFHKYVDMVNTSSGIPHISLQQIKEFEIPMPHPHEQAKIAGALSAMDAKIAAVQGQVDKMQDFKKGLLQQMFV